MRFYDFSGETKAIVCHGVLGQIRSCHRQRVSMNWCVQKHLYSHGFGVLTKKRCWHKVLRLPSPKRRWGHPFVPSWWGIGLSYLAIPSWVMERQTIRDLACRCLPIFGGNDSEPIAIKPHLSKYGAVDDVVRESSVSSRSSVFIDSWEGCVHSVMDSFGFAMASIMWKWVETVNMPWHGLLPHSFNCDPLAA